jgi:hypothetical protein
VSKTSIRLKAHRLPHFIVTFKAQDTIIHHANKKFRSANKQKKKLKCKLWLEEVFFSLTAGKERNMQFIIDDRWVLTLKTANLAALENNCIRNNLKNFEWQEFEVRREWRMSMDSLKSLKGRRSRNISRVSHHVNA